MSKIIIEPPENRQTEVKEHMLTLITSNDTRLSEDIIAEFLASYMDLKVEYDKLKDCLTKYNKIRQINN